MIASETASSLIGREAYEAYGEVTNFKNYQDLPMPKFDELTPEIKEAWGAAATRVFNLAYHMGYDHRVAQEKAAK